MITFTKLSQTSYDLRVKHARDFFFEGKLTRGSIVNPSAQSNKFDQSVLRKPYANDSCEERWLREGAA